MFDIGADTMFMELDYETRRVLASLLTHRNEYLEHVIELNRRKVALLGSPNPDGVEDLREYSSAFVAPVRHKMTEELGFVLKKAVDVDQIKEMLPMALMALTQSVNIPLLLTALGIDPDMITDVVSGIQDYFEDGMS